MCVRDACEPRARLKLGVGTHLCVQVAYFVFLREVTGAPRNAHSHSAFSDFSRDLASKHEIRDLDPYLSATVRYRARAPLERTAAPPRNRRSTAPSISAAARAFALVRAVRAFSVHITVRTSHGSVPGLLRINAIQ